MATRPYVDLPFGPLLPDYGGMPVTDLGAYLTDCVNLRSTPNGYRGSPSFADVAGATAIGGAMTYGHGWSTHNDAVLGLWFVNDSGAFYESRAEGTDTWTSVSPAAGSVLHPAGDFVRFGDDVIFAGRTRAPIYKSLSSAQATLFVNLLGSPPIAQCAARVRQHVMLGGLQGDDVYAVRWCAIGNHLDWPTPGTADALAKEAGSQSLNPEFGVVNRILGGEKFGIVVQETALTRMTYVGGSAVYEVDTYERIDGGGFSLYSRPVTDGTIWYYYNEDGLFATDGYAVKSLSAGAVDEALFYNTISHPNGTSLTKNYTSVYDGRRGEIIFGTTLAATTGYQLVYNIDEHRFSLTAEANQMEMFANYRTSATFKDQGRHVYNVNASNRKLQRRSGATGSIALQTGYIELDPGYKTQITGAHLLGAGVPGSLSLAYKSTSLLSAVDVAQTGFTTLTAAPRGMKATGRSTEQFHAFRVTGTGAESQLLKGIRVYFERGEPAT